MVDPLTKYAHDMKTPTTYDTFAALDMRVGEITNAEVFPEARRAAYKLSVDFGPEVGVLKTSAQITDHHAVKTLVGRRVIGVINLGTKRIAGFESQFLVLGSIDPDDTVRLLIAAPEADLGSPIA